MLKHLIFTAIVLLAVYIRLPLLSNGMPYFSDEDEAHHFNRTVNMLKTGDLNPHYFLKPSLHFYLRLPVTALAFFKSVSDGQIRSIQEVQTQDRFGLAGYSFSVSHTELLKANRLFSLTLLVAGMLVLIYIGQLLSLSSAATGLILGIIAISPSLQETSVVVGVDSLVFFLATLATALALKLTKSFNLTTLALLGLVCGLALASKYNAAPLALLPLITTVATLNRNWISYLIALIGPALGFLVGSPFILAEIPLFLDHFAYEIWHYGVAGHVGHIQVPGYDHFIFILTWLRDSAIGWTTFIIALFGLVFSFRKLGLSKLIVLLFFPAIYLFLMSSQKTSFTRNYLVLIPFALIFAGIALQKLSELKISSHLNRLIQGLIIVVCIAPLALETIGRHQINSILSQELDTREQAYNWLTNPNNSTDSTALDGELQIKPFYNYINGERNFSAPGLERTKLQDKTALDWFQLGYSRLVSPFGYIKKAATPDYLILKRKIRGTTALGRIVTNPEINIFDFAPTFWNQAEFYQKLNSEALPQITIDPIQPELSCPGFALEKSCWTTTRATALKLAKSSPQLKLEIMSPWEQQQFQIVSQNWASSVITLNKANAWQAVTIDIPAHIEKNNLLLLTKHLRAPSFIDINSKDQRHLGLAVR
jgi:hypothetical protein